MADDPSYEEVIPGDFVRYDNGPLGLVESIVDGKAHVCWLNNMGHGTVDWFNLTPIRQEFNQSREP